jgi:hypothetical protein
MDRFESWSREYSVNPPTSHRLAPSRLVSRVSRGSLALFHVSRRASRPAGSICAARHMKQGSPASLDPTSLRLAWCQEQRVTSSTYSQFLKSKFLSKSLASLLLFVCNGFYTFSKCQASVKASPPKQGILTLNICVFKMLIKNASHAFQSPSKFQKYMCVTKKDWWCTENTHE